MSEPVSLHDIKVHLRLDENETGEDMALAAMIIAARSQCETLTGRVVAGIGAETDVAIIAVFAHAIKVLVAAWYDDRAGEMNSPPAVAALLRPLRILGAPL